MKDMLQVYKRFLPFANFDKQLAQEISQLPENRQLQEALEETPDDNPCYPLILRRLNIASKLPDTMASVLEK
jgi:hypothetical protein